MKRNPFVSVVAIVLAALMVFGLVASVLPYAFAESSKDIMEKINELKKEAGKIDEKKDELQDKIDDKIEEKEGYIYQKSLIDEQINITLAEIDNTNALIEQYDLLIREKKDELKLAQNDEKELYSKYKDRLRALEENGKVTYWSILFKAKSFADLLDRIDTIQEIAQADRKMMAQLKDVSERIKVAEDELIESQNEQEAQKAVLLEQQADLEEQSAAAQALVEKLAAEQAEMQDVFDEYERMEDELMKELLQEQIKYQKQLAAEQEAARKKAEEEARKRGQTTGGGSGSGGSGSGSSSGGSSGGSAPSFMHPLGGPGYIITSPYGSRVHPVYGDVRFHNGIDISANQGTPIYAAASGKVTSASYSDSAGNYVGIVHSGGYSTMYLHMVKYVVSPGQNVSQGQLIGYVGTTGCSTGPHLHFSVYLPNGNTDNPAKYINF